jgi:hypothetical protein
MGEVMLKFDYISHQTVNKPCKLTLKTRRGLRLPEESTKKGGQGADTQQLEGEKGMAHAEVEEGKVNESMRCLPDKGRWTKDGNVRRSDSDRTKKEDMEMKNEVDGMCTA